MDKHFNENSAGHGFENRSNAARGEGYEAYRQKVIDACCELMGEHNRAFWETQCSWEEPFAELRDPKEVAQDQFGAGCPAEREYGVAKGKESNMTVQGLLDILSLAKHKESLIHIVNENGDELFSLEDDFVTIDEDETFDPNSSDPQVHIVLSERAGL